MAEVLNIQNRKPGGILRLGKECLCGVWRAFYLWEPEYCALMEMAAAGRFISIPFMLKRDRVDRCRRAIEKEECWRRVAEAIRIRLNQSSGNQSFGGVSRSTFSTGAFRWLLAMVQVTLSFNVPPLSVFFMVELQKYPFFKFTVFDNCASMYLTNDESFLEPDSIVEAFNDYVFSGQNAFGVKYRGTRVIKNALNGPDGLNIRDFVLKDVAYIPGFYVNCIFERTLAR